MKFKKNNLVFVLAAMMGLSACASADTKATNAQGDNVGKKYDQVTFAYATFNNIPTAETLDTVEEEINKITREKIGAEITLLPIGIAEYQSKVNLALQGGEKIDIFQSLGNFNNAVATDMALDITKLAEENAKESMELIGENWLNATTKDGKLYGIPTMKPIALTPMVIYRKDIADEIGLDMSKVQSLSDVTPILEQVKAAKPGITPLAPVQQGQLGLINTMKEVDWLSDSYVTPMGTLIGGNMTVNGFYETDEFKEISRIARDWYNKDLVMKDAATTTSSAAESMSSGNYFGYIAAYSYPEADTAASLEAQCGGYELGAKMIGDAYLTTSDINALTWMVTSNSTVAEAAVKFLNLTFTDKDIINLLIYGLEGRDYVLSADGYAAYPKGQDASTVPYTAQLSCGTLGNFFLMHPMEGTDKASLEWELEQNKTAKTSPVMGFSFDSGNYKTQYTAVTNVIQQYLPGLQCGSLDPETEIDKFVADLNAAGYQEIISAKQEQLDAWLDAR